MYNLWLYWQSWIFMGFFYVKVHFPGYHYCGPGTSSARIAKNETGINGLDEACRRHDLVYDRSEELKHRVEADIRLEHEAWARVIASDSNKWEKTAAWIVTNIMKMKRKWGTRKLRRMSQPREIGM